MRRWRTAATAVTLALVAVGASAGCGGDDEDALSADEQRYCELAGELEEIGGEVFGSLPEEPSDDELAAAEKRFVEEADAELNELVEVAPEEIAEDVEAYVEGFRARARGEDSQPSDENIVEWEEENCPA